MEANASTVDTPAQAAGPVIAELETARTHLASLNERVVGFVQEHPGKCLLGAIALGYLAARLARGQARA